MEFKNILPLSLFFILLSGNAYAQISEYYVKQTGSDTNTGIDSWVNAVASIQRAIEIVRAEDPPADVRRIHVGAGTYNEQINLDAGADRVQLLGGYPNDAVDGDTRDWTANETTIDGSNEGTVVVIQGLSGAGIEGFTIRNGGRQPGEEWGGGIYVDNCINVVLAHNRIENNHGGPWGSGIAWTQSGGVISANTISNNRNGFYEGTSGGGGIRVSQVRLGCRDGICPVRILGNSITNNITAHRGGGITVISMWGDEQYAHSPVEIRCNTIEGNRAGGGGGINATESSVLIQRNAIRSNIATTGGGIELEDVIDSTIRGNVIKYNEDDPRWGGWGGGINFVNSRAVAFRNIIAFNRSVGEGDGIYIRGDSHVPLVGVPVFIILPAGDNCIHNNGDRDLYYTGAIPEGVWANLNYWGSSDRRYINARIEGINPDHWLHILPSCPVTESSLLPVCTGQSCTVEELRECLNPTL